MSEPVSEYIQHMSSVPYFEPERAPSWWRTAWEIFVGWILGAACLIPLYVAGWFLGVIGVNGGPSDKGFVNQWPFPDNGWRSLAANFSVLLLAALVGTVTVAWKLRESFETVSEARLAVVLVLTGVVPLVTPSESGAAVGFLIATWAVRKWVVRAGHRFSRRALGLSALALMLTVASYGALHPVWVESATVVPSPSGSHEQSTLRLRLHNASWGTVVVESLSGGPLFPRAIARRPAGPQLPPGVRIEPRASKSFALVGEANACATELPSGRIRYHLFGLTLSSPLRIKPYGSSSCP